MDRIVKQCIGEQSESRKNTILWIMLALYIIAVMFSLAHLKFPDVSFPSKLYGDSGFYDNSAVGLSLGRGYIDNDGNLTYAYQIGYPFFLSLLYRLGLRNYYLIAAVQQCMLLITFLVFLKLLQKSAYGNLWRILFPLLFITNYSLMMLANSILSETLALFLITVCMAIVFFFSKKNKNEYLYVLAGVIFGCAVLTRPVFQLFPILFVIISFYKYLLDKQKRILKVSIYLFLGSIVVIAPYQYRNYTLFGLPNLSGSAGYNLYQATNAEHDGEFASWPHIVQELRLSDTADYNALGVKIKEVDGKLMAASFQNFKKNPIGTVKVYCKNFSRVYFFLFNGSKSLQKRTLGLVNIFVFILFFIGLVKNKFILPTFRDEEVGLTWTVLLAVYSIFMVPLFGTDARYGTILMPMIYYITFSLYYRSKVCS